MLKAIINGVEKDIVRIPMIGDDSTYKEGWEIRDQQDRLIWGKNNTLTGVSSISFRGYGIPLKSIKIVGNTQQNGTPAPDAPIMPEFVGERTINLYDDTSTVTLPSGVRYGMGFPSGTYSIRNDTDNIVYDFTNSGTSRHELCQPHSTATITFLDEWGECGFFMAYNDASLGGVTIVSGSTPPDHYIPYGFQIPITCAGQTTPIYLGQTQTVRRIKKLVLTGEEDWVLEFDDHFYTNNQIPGAKYATLVACTHQQSIMAHYEASTRENVYISSSGRLNFTTQTITHTIEAFTDWLKSQYAAGTPVIIWYVLANEQTGIVNEPLAKIGDYADELHSTDAGVSIPTTEGSNTLSIDTTLHPSNIEITGHIKSHTVYVMTYIDYTDMTKSYTIGDVNKVNAFTQRRRCNMLDDGTITAFYCDPTFIEDGSNGQVMVYQPKFYYKVEPVLLDGIKIRKCKYYISDYQLPGYKLHPAFIDRTDPNNLKEFPFVCIGAYEGCLQNGDTYITDDSASSTSYKLSSIAFTDTATNGIKPSSGVISPFGTIGNYETTASNRGTGWHIENIWITSMNQLMFVIEMCNPNSQTALGSGVTNIPDTPNTANNASLVGSTSSLGNGSGRATTTYSNYNGTTTAQTAGDKTAVSYRGMENPFGNIWKWVDGMTIKNTSATEHTPYICKSFAYTRNSTLTNYDMVNVTIPGNGYVTAFGYDPNFDWLFISAETNSSNIGSIRDYLYTMNSDYTCALLGGRWYSGARAGLFCWHLGSGSSARGRNVSARICYLPQ